MQDLDFYHIVNVFAAEKLVENLLKIEPNSFFRLCGKVFFSFCSIASTNDKNIVEFFCVKHGLQFWRYILNVSYFFDRFSQKLYTTRPALTYALANDCLKLSILLAWQKWKRSRALSFGRSIHWVSTGTDWVSTD